MTRKERAITNLKQMCSDGRYLGSGSYAPLEVLEDFNLAIKALEKEPTTKDDLGVDCISRAQTQTKIEMNASRYTIAKERGGMGQVEWSDQLIKVSDAVDIIRHLPPVTPQEPRWIPVSERLPNLDDYTGLKEWQKKVLITGYLSFDDTKELFVSEAFVDDVINHAHDTIIKAWMPLPEPYKAESEN